MRCSSRQCSPPRPSEQPRDAPFALPHSFPVFDCAITKSMEQRRLGRSGPAVSAIGLGCMNIGIADVYTSAHDDDDAIALIHRALDLGITLLDTADIYGVSERRWERRSAAGEQMLYSPPSSASSAPLDPEWNAFPTAALTTSAAPAKHRSNASVSIPSTSTICTAWTPGFQLRRPSVRWQSWYDSAKCAISASPKLRPRPSVARTQSIPSPQYRPSTRCGHASRSRGCFRCFANLASPWLHTAPWVAGFSPDASGSSKTSRRMTGAATIRASRVKFREERRRCRSCAGVGARQRLHTGAVGTRLAAEPAGRDPDSGHQQPGSADRECPGRGPASFGERDIA